MQSKQHVRHVRLSLAIAVIAFTLGGCAGTATTAGPALGDPAPITSPTATLVVHGMSCPLCANNVDKQLMTIRGVQSVGVDMGTGEVKVSLAPGARVTKGQLADAIDKSGFTLTEVRIP